MDFLFEWLVWFGCPAGKLIMLLRINANVGSTDYTKMYYRNPLILKTINLTLSFFPLHTWTNEWAPTRAYILKSSWRCLCFSETFVWSGGADVGSLPIPAGSNIWAISPRQNWIQDWIFIIIKKHYCRHYHRKNQIVVKNLRIVAQWWTLSESRLFKLYFGVFQPSVWSKDYYGSMRSQAFFSTDMKFWQS